MQHRHAARIVCSIIAGGMFSSLSAAQEMPAEIIAAHIRMQGYACDKALAAERNPAASRPDEAVWTLRCDNGTYRVRLVPDMAAQVETMK